MWSAGTAAVLAVALLTMLAGAQMRRARPAVRALGRLDEAVEAMGSPDPTLSEGNDRYWRGLARLDAGDVRP